MKCHAATEEFITVNNLERKMENHMSLEQNPTQWIDSQVQRQTASTKTRKSMRIARSRRQADRRDRPLNVLGCLALIHAVRSVDSGDRTRVSARRATTA
jgi:hypothetical protein